MQLQAQLRGLSCRILTSSRSQAQRRWSYSPRHFCHQNRISFRDQSSRTLDGVDYKPVEGLFGKDDLLEYLTPRRSTNTSSRENTSRSHESDVSSSPIAAALAKNQIELDNLVLEGDFQNLRVRGWKNMDAKLDNFAAYYRAFDNDRKLRSMLAEEMAQNHSNTCSSARNLALACVQSNYRGYEKTEPLRNNVRMFQLWAFIMRLAPYKFFRDWSYRASCVGYHLKSNASILRRLYETQHIMPYSNRIASYRIAEIRADVLFVDVKGTNFEVWIAIQSYMKKFEDNPRNKGARQALNRFKNHQRSFTKYISSANDSVLAFHVHNGSFSEPQSLFNSINFQGSIILSAGHGLVSRCKRLLISRRMQDPHGPCSGKVRTLITSALRKFEQDLYAFGHFWDQEFQPFLASRVDTLDGSELKVWKRVSNRILYNYWKDVAEADKAEIELQRQLDEICDRKREHKRNREKNLRDMRNSMDKKAFKVSHHSIRKIGASISGQEA